MGERGLARVAGEWVRGRVRQYAREYVSKCLRGVRGWFRGWVRVCGLAGMN